MKKELEYEKDFYVVNEEVWSWIVKHIGGGPKIKLYVSEDCPFQIPLVTSNQEPNLISNKAIYENDVKLVIEGITSTMNSIQLPSIMSSNDLLRIIKSEFAKLSAFKVYLDGNLITESPTLLSLSTSSNLRIEESLTPELDKEFHRTDSTGICTPLFSDKHEIESFSYFVHSDSFSDNYQIGDSNIEISKKILQPIDFESFRLKEKKLISDKKLRPKRLPMKRIHENMRKLILTLSDEIYLQEENFKQEKLEISSEDTLEEPLENGFFSIGRTKKNDNLFEEELKCDEEESEFGV